MKKQLQGYVAGVLSAILMVGGTAYAKSRMESIDVTYDNIKVYIDNSLAELKDANGTTVEPFIYNGTTFLPVRGVARAMGSQVTWDGKTKSVYIWDEMVPGGTSFLNVCEPYHERGTTLYTNGKTFKMDGKSYTNGLKMSDGEALFNLDGRFESISFDIGHYDMIGAEKDITFIVDGEVVKTITLDPEQLVEHRTISLDYGLQLKIVVDSRYVGIANITVE